MTGLSHDLQLGAASTIPPSPEQARLDRVPMDLSIYHSFEIDDEGQCDYSAN